MIAGIEQRGDRQMQCGHAARGADCADAGFERGEPFFQHSGRGVRNPCVDVADTFEVEQSGGMVGILEHIGRGLIDRNRPCTGGGIRTLAGVQAERFEGRRLGCGHAELVSSMGRE